MPHFQSATGNSQTATVSKTFSFQKKMTRIVVLTFLASLAMHDAVSSDADQGETLAELSARLGAESNRAYEASPYSVLSRDYF